MSNLRRPMKRPVVWILVGTLFHFVASASSFLWSYSITSARFEGHAVSHTAAVFAKALTSIMWFPVAEPLMKVLPPLPGIMGWLPVLANSGLWAVAFVAISRWIFLSTRRLPHG